MTVSYHLAHFLLNATVRGVPFSFDQLWLAALVALPTDGSPAGSEVTASEYERVALAFAAPTGTNKYVSAGQASFGAASSSWGVISHLGLASTATKGEGIIYVAGTLTGTPSISANQILQINDVRLAVS